MTLIEKDGNAKYIPVEEEKHDHKFASKGIAGTGLGLGIAGTALWLLNSLGGGNGLFGSNNASKSLPSTQDMNTAITALGSTIMRTIDNSKECKDVLAITNKMWQNAYDEQLQRFNDERIINRRFFDMYDNTQAQFNANESKRVNDKFEIYKYTRDNRDMLLSEVGELKAELAVLKATRPYQDKIIQMNIDNAAQCANFNLFRRTCKMIEGQLVLPSTPTVTGYGSYNSCNCNSNTTPAVTA